MNTVRFALIRTICNRCRHRGVANVQLSSYLNIITTKIQINTIEAQSKFFVLKKENSFSNSFLCSDSTKKNTTERNDKNKVKRPIHVHNSLNLDF